MRFCGSLYGEQHRFNDPFFSFFSFNPTIGCWGIWSIDKSHGFKNGTDFADGFGPLSKLYLILNKRFNAVRLFHFSQNHTGMLLKLCPDAC
jgi:hypothetical protein